MNCVDYKRSIFYQKYTDSGIHGLHEVRNTQARQDEG